MVDRRSYSPVDLVPIAGFVTHTLRNRLWEDIEEILEGREKLKLWGYVIYQSGLLTGVAYYLASNAHLQW